MKNINKGLMSFIDKTPNAYYCANNIKKILEDNGYQEVVLTGIHTGHYGEDSGYTFPKLLSEIVKIPLFRLRISSIEITELNDDFLEVLRNNSVIVDHLHIPLQSWMYFWNIFHMGEPCL